jgi:hypothetical protein
MRKHSSFQRLLAGAAFASLLGLAGQASANIVANGGFETGDFTGWTSIGQTAFNGVMCPGSGTVLEGHCEAFFGPIGTLGGIQQTLATAVGQVFTISFMFQGDGGVPGFFEADFGGQTLVSQTNGVAGVQAFSFSATATAANTVLKFQFRDDPGFMLLDNVQVNAAIPEPASLALAGIALAGLAASRARKRH